MADKKFDDEMIDVSQDSKINVSMDVENSNKIGINANNNGPKNPLQGNDKGGTNIPKHDNNAFNNQMQNNMPKDNKNGNKPGNNGNTLGRNNPLNKPNNPNDKGQNNPLNKNGQNGLNNENVDNRSLAQKAKDAKQNAKDTVDKIKNAPQNIKDKINDTKNKIKDTKDKVKELPNKAKEKMHNAKQKWDNRPKSFSEFKDRTKGGIKNASSKLANKAKQGVKTAAKAGANAAKEGAKEAFEESSLGKTVKKTKETVENAKATVNVTKKAFKNLIKFFKVTFPWLEIILAIGIAIVAILIIIQRLKPGSISFDGSSGDFSNYTERDRQTLNDMANIFGSSNANNSARAMATVAYPYYTQLYDGNVLNYVYTSGSEEGEGESDSIDEQKDDNFLLQFRDATV